MKMGDTKRNSVCALSGTELSRPSAGGALKQQQSQNILNSTNAASKGLYREQPGSRSQSIFQGVANLRLSGSTFNAGHMDKFMGTEFAQTASPSRIYALQNQNNWSQARATIKEIRQSSNFTSIDRDLKGQQRFFVDQYNGPSTLMTRQPSDQTLKDKTGGAKTIFDIEREQHQKVPRDFNNITKQLLEDNGGLKSPKQRQEEMRNARQEMNRYKEFKNIHNQVNKRDRALRNSWKHGITGVESPEDKFTSLYKDQQTLQTKKQIEKDHINASRFSKLTKQQGVSSQLDFGRTGVFDATRNDNKVTDISQIWTRKRVSPVRHEDTHAAIFIQPESTVNPLRTAKLRLEDRRDKPFNLLSGEAVSLI